MQIKIFLGVYQFSPKENIHSFSPSNFFEGFY
jgi:hypothetical protein